MINYRLFIDNTVVLWINFEFKKIQIDWAYECGTWLGPLNVQLYCSLIIFSMSGLKGPPPHQLSSFVSHPDWKCEGIKHKKPPAADGGWKYLKQLKCSVLQAKAQSGSGKSSLLWKPSDHSSCVRNIRIPQNVPVRKCYWLMRNFHRCHWKWLI